MFILTSEDRYLDRDVESLGKSSAACHGAVDFRSVSPHSLIRTQALAARAGAEP
jgi:hypothetical protein